MQERRILKQELTTIKQKTIIICNLANTMDNAKQIKDNPFDIRKDRPDHDESSLFLHVVVSAIAERQKLGIWTFNEGDVMAGIELAERN